MVAPAAARTRHASGPCDTQAVVLVHGIVGASQVGFADLLDCHAQKSRPNPNAAAVAAAPGLIQIFVAPKAELHLLAWRPRALQRPPIAAIVPVADAHLEPAWRQALVPHADIAATGIIASGLAAFDGEGLKARFEFAWAKGADGQWALADDKRTARPRGQQLLEPIAAATPGSWSASCGRCLRYPLAHRSAVAPQLALCRRDCLTRATPF
jgi:hypothetical protein